MMRTIIPTDVSANEKMLRRLDSRDKLVRTFEVVVLLSVVVLNVFAISRITQLGTQDSKNISAHRYQVEDAAKMSEQQLRTASLANRTRLDVDLCIVSVPPQTRTPEYVHKCYDDAEKSNNVKIQRFGYGL